MIPYYIQDLATQCRIFVAERDSVNFLLDLCRPLLSITNDLLDCLDNQGGKMTFVQQNEIICTIRDIQDEIDYYQSILLKSFQWRNNHG